MANEEHLAILRQGVKTWNKWRREYPNIADLDLSKADLRHANLTNANLASANLAGANLASANLCRANLRNANLAGTALIGTKAGLDMSGTVLTVAVLMLLLLMATMIPAGLGGGLAGNTLANIAKFFKEQEYRNIYIPFTVVYTTNLTITYIAIMFGGYGWNISIIFAVLAIVGATTWFIGPGEHPALWVTLVSLAWAGSGTIFATGLRCIPETAIHLMTGRNIATILSVATALVTTGFMSVLSPVFSNAATIVGLVVAATGTLFSLHIAQRALAGDQRYTLVRQLAINITSIWGTSFRGANLTEASFVRATLKNTDFRGATLLRTRWGSVAKLGTG